MPECTICQTLRDQIGDLRDRLAVALAHADPAIPAVPWEWALTREQAVAAIAVARGSASLSRIAAALDLADPAADWPIRRAHGVVKALCDRLGHHGWILCSGALSASQAPPRSTTQISIHPDQLGGFRAAIRCEGSASAPPIHQRAIEPGTRAYQRGAA